MSTVDEALSLPPQPADIPSTGFPMLATLAPLVAAGLIWTITGSPFALIFAVLSPVIAVASMFDSRRTGRRRRRRELVEHGEAIAVLRSRISARHTQWRADAWERTPSAREIILDRAAAARWRQTDATRVAIGTGTASSGIRLGGAETSDDSRHLRQWASVVDRAPIVIELSHGLGLVGSAPLTAAVARAVCVQLCFALPPTEMQIALEVGKQTTAWDWVTMLPHAVPAQVGKRPQQVVIVLRNGTPGEPTGGVVEPGRLLVALATRLDDLPPGCGTVVQLDGPSRAHIIRSPDRVLVGDFCPELLALTEIAPFAVTLAEQARSIGLVSTEAMLPNSVTLTTLLAESGEVPWRAERGSHGTTTGATAPETLDCVIGMGSGGPVRIDLVSSGPHAVVGGTTGSGKSELLISWVAALAATYSPREVNILLVDFKGGAAFQHLSELAHCVGLITDLDSGEAARALASLAAELRYRERILSAAGARDVTDSRLAEPLPRLVIVVDEFATMLGVFPELHALFVDIAARGRSLGVHLILCTQRPAGVVRDALLANCSLRLSLRVNNRADSQAVIGTDAAAALLPTQPGRCWVARENGEPVLCQVATTGEIDIEAVEAVERLRSTGYVARRPWRDPLARRIEDCDLQVAYDGTAPLLGYALGVLDEPEHQRHRVFRYDPGTDGHLLVVGGAGSGKSTFLKTLSRAAEKHSTVELIFADVERAWDALVALCERVETGNQSRERPCVVLFDDFDSVCARWQPDHRITAVDLLTGLLRDGPAAGVHIVIAMQRITSLMPGLAALCPSSVLLKLPSLQDHLAAGGQTSGYHKSLPPGGGVWRNVRVQLLAPLAEPLPAAGSSLPAGLPTLPPSILPLPSTGALLVVSSRPSSVAARLRAGLGESVIELAGTSKAAATGLSPATTRGRLIIVGDPDAWQAHWALLALLRTQSAKEQEVYGGVCLVFDRCSLSDYRSISHQRLLPPPLGPGIGRVWVVHPEGRVTRAVLPDPVLPTVR